ncbi:hypothetical protein E2P81_ATG06401 [Venturia nashicola]|nr:hypothetical protein E2P81_ATG06401 [Venturia nashicola]
MKEAELRRILEIKLEKNDRGADIIQSMNEDCDIKSILGLGKEDNRLSFSDVWSNAFQRLFPEWLSDRVAACDKA